VCGLLVAVTGLLYLDEDSRLGEGLTTLLPEQPAARPGPARPAPTQPGSPELKTHFDFWELLPEMDRPVPEPRSHQPRPAPSGTQYVLQAASYDDFIDADRLKARLAINNIEAYIEKVIIGERGIFFRVRVGPFQKLSALDDVHRRLEKLGISAMRLEVRTRDKARH
jgi:cell division protein FtsN